MTKRIAVLDADIFVYKVAQAATKEIMFDEYSVTIGDSKEAIVALDNWFHHVKDKVGADDIVLAFTGKNNYRKDIWPEYKMHRQTPKPALMIPLREYCEKKYRVLVDDKLEADDLVGQHMSETYVRKDAPFYYIGVSEDKDLLGVPGAIFNPAKDAIVQHTTLEEAITFFYTQVLTGDTSDGYKGVPGVGLVKAAKWILGARQESEGVYEFIGKAWDVILKVYDKAGLDKQEAYENASMAKILWYGESASHFAPFKLQEYWRKKHGK
jgi:DNA polymerase-1